MPKSGYKPSEETRRQVKIMAGIGLPEDQICTLVNLRSPKTLRRYFSKELSGGRAECNIKIRQTAYNLAISGTNPKMTMFLLRTRLRWRPGMKVNPQTSGDPEVIYIYEDYQLPAASEQASED